MLQWISKRGDTFYGIQVFQRGLLDLCCCEIRESSSPLSFPLRPQAAATDIYQWVRSWKVDDVGNAGVFDNVELGTEADVFHRASLILCPHTPFWSSVQLSEQLIPLSTPLSCHLPPSFPPLHTAPAYNPCLHTSNRGTSLPWQPFSSHNNLSRHGNRA